MSKRILLLCGLLLAGILTSLMLSSNAVSNAQPPFTQGPPVVNSSTWQAEFYNNTDFTGAVAAQTTYTDAQIASLNFGTNAQPAGVNPDNFSAIIRTARTLNAGNVVFRAFADDRLEVRVNGQQILNITQPNTGQEVTYPVPIAGTYNIELRFIEFAGPAFLQFQISATGSVPGGPTFTPLPSPTATITPLPPIPPGAITATVIRAAVLNTRDAPSLGGNRIGRVLRGQTYAIVGRDADARWFLLQLSGYQGWAWGYYLFIDGNEFNPPVISGNTILGLAGQPDFGVRGQAQAGLRLREGPSIGTRQIGRITWGAFLPIVGRTPDGFWYKTVWKDTVGWVYAPYIDIIEGDLNVVPAGT
jgi:hypothetical protein